MRPNRKGMTGIADAMFFILLIGLSVAIVTACGDTDDGRVAVMPSSACDTVFQSELSGADLGMDMQDQAVHPFPVLAAISMRNGDGCAAAYAKEFLDRLYPWNGAYRLEMTLGDLNETVGGGTGEPDLWLIKEYSTIYSGPLKVSLYIYR